MVKPEGQKLKILIGFILTIASLHFVPQTLITLTVLLLFWGMLFWPWTKIEQLAFIIASAFFLGQNYSVLTVGGFTFKNQDILLMPSYEPFLWGFYFLSLKRFIDDPMIPARVDKKAVFGLFLTAFCFAIFAKNSTWLLYATIISSGTLLFMFHENYDLHYAFTALALGFVVEIFGVQTGLWSYPKPDIIGIPYWFATMWISVGLLGRRFLIPLTTSIIRKFETIKKI